MTTILQATTKRRPYRAPVGLPGSREDWRVGSVVSVIVHLGIIVLLFAPIAILGELNEIGQGAGGAGPAGGGGGGNRGTGAQQPEVLRYVALAPQPAPAAPVRETVEPPRPVLPQLSVLPDLSHLKAPEPLSLRGIGGGTGVDAAGGSGSGTGGGTGTGVGTGRGSATGAGTGGGTQSNYPPTPTEIFIPPLPVPASVKGHHLIANFDVDATGKVLSMTFNETRDRGYNRRLAEVLRGFRFRPGTRPDGTPIRMIAQVAVDLY